MPKWRRRGPAKDDNLSASVLSRAYHQVSVCTDPNCSVLHPGLHRGICENCNRLHLCSSIMNDEFFFCRKFSVQLRYGRFMISHIIWQNLHYTFISGVQFFNVFSHLYYSLLIILIQLFITDCCHETCDWNAYICKIVIKYGITP